MKQQISRPRFSNWQNGQPLKLAYCLAGRFGVAIAALIVVNVAPQLLLSGMNGPNFQIKWHMSARADSGESDRDGSHDRDSGDADDGGAGDAGGGRDGGGGNSGNSGSGEGRGDRDDRARDAGGASRSDRDDNNDTDNDNENDRDDGAPGNDNEGDDDEDSEAHGDSVDLDAIVRARRNGAVRAYSVLRAKVLRVYGGHVVGVRRYKSRAGITYIFRVIDRSSRLIDVYLNARTARISKVVGR